MALTYKEKLLDPRWQKKRLQVLKKHKFQCQYCRDRESTLHVHHLRYADSRNPWDSPLVDLTCVCNICHMVIEFVKKERIECYFIEKSQLRNGEIQLILFSLNICQERCVDIFHFNKESNSLTYKTSINELSLKLFNNKINKYNNSLKNQING